MQPSGRLLAMVASLAVVACASSGDADEARTAIRKVLDDQVAAWNKGDLPGFMEGYWKSPELTFFAGKEATRGWQALFDRYRKKYQAEGKQMGKLAFTDLEIELIAADRAMVRGRWRVVLPKESPQGLFTLLVKKLPGGWRITHDHTSG